MIENFLGRYRFRKGYTGSDELGDYIDADTYELEPEVPPVEPPPTPPEPPPEGLPEWLNVPIVNGVSPEIKVDLPPHHIGIKTIDSVDPNEVATFNNGLWVLRRDWNEAMDGGHIDFGQARIDARDHTLSGFRLRTVEGGVGCLLNGEFTDGEVIGTGVAVKVVTGNGDCTVRRTKLLGVSGDMFICGRYVNLVIEDCFGWVLAVADSAMHQDGVQVHDARTGANGGYANINRLVIDWNDAGTVAGTTGALFTQGSARLDADNVLVLRPGGTHGIVRTEASGEQNLGTLQVIGNQRPNVKTGNLEPDELVWGKRWATIYNDVPGAIDYR